MFRILIRCFRRLALGVSFVYWALFLGNSAVMMIKGGPERVLVWYRHIGQASLQLTDGQLILPKFEWSTFAAGQIFNLVLPWVLFF
jgi:hypothetical protein